MVSFTSVPLLLSLLLYSSVFALPTDILPNSTNVNETIKAIEELFPGGKPDGPNELSILGMIGQSDPFQGILTSFLGTKAGPTPDSVEDAVSRVNDLNKGKVTNLYTHLAKMVSAGMVHPSVDLVAISKGDQPDQGSTKNDNPKEPTTAVYPQKDAGDAPYSLDEATLRAAIYIPSTFTYGQKPPTILTPGTGNTGFQTFNGNFIKQLTDVDYADPVWLNIPGNLAGDAQVNSEYVAYAMNYISGISGGQKVTVICWSQGGLNTQWALKYWPSTRDVTSNFIAISPDYHGTVLATIPCPGFPINLLACAPSVIQQDFTSDFVNTLRSDGGDSAYVPTTTIYSATDEIVQPMSGTEASGFLQDTRGVGVTNNQVQEACADQTAGGLYTHEGVLYNPLAWELAKDAMINGGPGQLDRLDRTAACDPIVADGLGVEDVLLTESALLVAGVNLLTYPEHVSSEPPIVAYA